MQNLPDVGEVVKFRIAEGHLVPMPGRPGRFYPVGETIEEAWKPEHVARVRTGALLLEEWSRMPKSEPMEGEQ
jgi:hypothetical protein